MFVFGICRLDAGAEGIHLAWSGPDEIQISALGYDIQRRVASNNPRPPQCVAIGDPERKLLADKHEMVNSLGVLLYRQGASLETLTAKRPSDPQVQFRDPGPRLAGARKLSSSSSATTRPTEALPRPAVFVEVFTQELNAPAAEVAVSGHAGSFLVLALRAGKAIRAVEVTGDGSTTTLAGPRIDSVVIYATALKDFKICAAPPLSPAREQGFWKNVPYLVKGLTLPVKEADPTLVSAALELAAAKTRLTGPETFTQSEFNALTPSLRQGAGHPELGRPGDRILLFRSTVEEPFQELTFSQQLALLQLSPRGRRVLGFGYADPKSSGLVPGQSYEYRITGHFRAEDLADSIYDVHTTPAGTTLPDTFRIRDVRFRFPRPVRVVLDPKPPETALISVSRRGISVETADLLPGWRMPSLDDWSAVIDLPRPVERLVIETNATHNFRYAAGDAWLFNGSEADLPPGPVAALSFASPITQLRLRGTGVLFAIRIPAGTQTGLVTQTVTTGPVVLAEQPLPEAPTAFTIANLQTPPAPMVGSADESATPPPRAHAGFRLEWTAAATGGVSQWPANDPAGPSTAPPIDAVAFQIEHRPVLSDTPSGPWEPIQPGDNLSLGTRDQENRRPALEHGADLAESFPARRLQGASGVRFHLSDVFDLKETTKLLRRAVPGFGSKHQYRIRAMDTVGRVSAAWTESSIARLEKHIPPPQPAGPQPPIANVPGPDGAPTLGGPSGVTARALIAGDPNLSAADQEILDGHANAIVLDWGWRNEERQLDSLAHNFRVYRWSTPPDVVPGQITSVASAPAGGWNLAFSTDRRLKADECKGQWITTESATGGYAFRIASHAGGSNVTIHVDPAVARPTQQPGIGPACFGRPRDSHHARPALWDERVAIIPVTNEVSYRHVFFDVFTLSPEHPLDTVWVGVSAADSESYVPDEVPASRTNGGQPGNESSLAACAVSARYAGRPVFSIAAPLGEFPEQVAEEPTGRQVLVSLDLPALLPSALASNAPVALERCGAESIFRILSLNASAQIEMRMQDGETTQVVVFPARADQAAVVAALQDSRPERIENRHLVYLAGQHQRSEEIFERVGGPTAVFGTLTDRLPPHPARYLYRIRRADAVGHLSAGAAILPVVLRVPSTAPPAAPDRVALHTDSSGVTLDLRVPDDTYLTYLLVFSKIVPANTPFENAGEAELLRIPNRRDLYPNAGIQLRTASGAMLAPLVKDLADAGVIHAEGRRTASVHVPVGPARRITLWCYSLSRDGIPSRLSGPFSAVLGSSA